MEINAFMSCAVSQLRYVVADHSPSIHPLFIRSLNVTEHLNVTTLLGDNINPSPVAGLRPRRSRLFLENIGVAS